MEGRDASCELCHEVATGTIPDHPDWPHPSPSARHRARWASLNVVSSLVPIVPGHLLVFPDEHVTAFSASGSTGLTDLERLVQDQSEFWQSQGLELLALEHGTGVGQVGSGIDHAHAHLVPVSSEAADRSIEVLRQRAPDDAVEQFDHISPHSSYLMAWRPATRERVIVPGDYPSQTLRRLVAAAAESPHLDWHGGGDAGEFERAETRLLAWAGGRMPISTPGTTQPATSPPVGGSQ